MPVACQNGVAAVTEFGARASQQRAGATSGSEPYKDRSGLAALVSAITKTNRPVTGLFVQMLIYYRNDSCQR